MRTRHQAPEWKQTQRVGWFVYAMIVPSIVAVPIFLLSYHNRWTVLVGPAASGGSILAAIGLGCALWWTIRVRKMSCVLALIVSLFPFALWSFFIYRAIHDKPFWPPT